MPESRQSLSERLSQWLDWTDAIALSTALNPSASAVPGGRALGGAEEKECARVRASLSNAIVGDSTLTAKQRERRHAHAPSDGAAMDAAVDYSLFRQRYLSLQQAMETSIGNLRGRLRDMLSARTPGMTRLAMVDAVMEQALSARERTLLAAVPMLLGAHFERLRKAEQETLADARAPGDVTAVTTPGAWLDVFRKDMQSVLLAELDLRFQPVEGLLAALRTS